jgi:hypothetical protein
LVVDISVEAGGASLLMIRGYAANGGTLMKQGGNVVVATGVHGKWVRVNVIHDATNRKMSVYIDGQLKVSENVGTVGPDRPFHYHKWGCYGTLRTESAQVEWRNVTLYMK